MATLERTLTAPAGVGTPAQVGRLLRDMPLVPTAILAVLVLAAVFAGVLAPYDPTLPIAGARIFQPPFWMDGGTTNALLGTDFQGRDVLSRLIFGARVSLLVGVTGTVIAGGIGLVLGILAGYVGGWVDQAVMRLTDAWLALPFLMFAIFLAALLGAGALIIVRHILPNVLNTWTVLASLTVGVVIVTEASLSFLGVGVPPPTPAWGSMLAEARSTLLAGQWWLTVFPGVCISVVVLASNIFGDWLRV